MKKMKKLLIIISVAGAALLTACQESSTLSNRIAVALHANYLHPDRTEFQVPNTASSATFTVNSQDTPWRIDDVPAWISISPKSGSATTTVTVNTEDYAWADPRIGIFTLYSDSNDWSYSKQMTVTQTGATPYVNIEKTYFSFDGAANSERVAASGNFNWQVSNNNNNWITVNYDGSGMTVSVTANDTGEIRSGDVYVKYNANVMATITVSQVPAEVSLKTDQLDFPIGSGSYKLTVTSQAAWRTDAPSWLDVIPSSGEPGTTEVTISSSPNPYDNERNGSVYFIFASSQMQFAEVPIHQDGLILELVEGAEYFNAMSSLNCTLTAHLHSNSDWTIYNDAYFMTVSPMSGSGDTTLSITLNENASFNWRSGWLYLVRPETGYQINYSVQQKPRSYELNTTYLECNDLAQDLHLDVKTEGGWSLVPDAGTDFFTATPLSSQGDTRVTVSVQENTNTYNRSGGMQFHLLNIEGYSDPVYMAYVSVSQFGWQDKYQRVQQAVELAARGGSMTVDVASNDAWSAAFSSGGSWIRMDGETSGKGAGGFTVVFDPNQTIDARSVKVLITFEHLDPVEMTLTQLGKAIRISSDALYFFAKGGSCTVAVDADGTYSVAKASGDWFTVTPDESNNTFTVRAEAYSGDVDRTGSIVLSLTDLASGSYSVTLPVMQTTAAGFTRGGWQEDRDLNIGSASGFSFQVTGYSEDQNWNGGRHASVGGEGYDDDENWN